MERETFKAIPLDTSVFTNRLSHSTLAMEKYLAINDKVMEWKASSSRNGNG